MASITQPHLHVAPVRVAFWVVMKISRPFLGLAGGLCTAGALAIAVSSGCAAGPAPAPPSVATNSAESCAVDPIPNVVTADIAEGIEAHVEREVDKGGGYFVLPWQGRTLKLHLVRVHLEYLSTLGPHEHFACVDLVDVSGDVFDVDFFLKGDPGAMAVTDTTVHKKNGQPFYAWDQADDGSWRRIPVDAADPKHLGLVTGEDAFTFIYRYTLPALSGSARLWLPLPSSDRFQTVAVKAITAPGRQQTLEDRAHGNRVLFLDLGPTDGGKTVELRFDVRRREKAAYEEGGTDVARFLTPDAKVPKNTKFDEIARQVLDGKKGEMVRARALYDHVIDQMRYMKYGEGWGVGDASYACDSKTGNCSDFHSYFIALARTAGIPARFAIGAAIPSERDDGGIDGYHCWAEFFAEGKWWPVDISEGDKYSRLATYYFGHHPANRVELSRGRDLVVEPGPAGGPINMLAYPVLEVDGKAMRAKPEFAFERHRGR